MQRTNPDDLCVILHGGAGKYSPRHSQKKLPDLERALEAAWSVLIAGNSGIEAVAAALRVMEGSEYFNAGFGGYPNVDGIVLLDVGLMKGTGEFVSLINMRRVKYPSAVALDMFNRHKQLMSIWTYELECALDEESDEMREHYGVVDNHDDLIAPFVRQLFKDREGFELTSDDAVHGTVGCVVRDAFGEIHAGTSTGGISLKFNGRVGDSPVIGSGVYADNEIGGLSTTGNGEAFLRSSTSGFTLAEMRRSIQQDVYSFASNKMLRELLRNEIDEMSRKSPGQSGAIIVVPKHGRPAYAFNSEMVSLAYRIGNKDTVKRSKVLIARENGDDIIHSR